MQNKSTNKEIKGYKILGKIAKGGMGELYKGIHPGLNKEIILKKLISKATASFSDRFKREAALMMEVSHPNVVHLFDYFREGNSSYIVMEYIPGYNLSEFIGKFGKLPVYLAAYIAFEVAKGLEYAHSKGIIHRDIKPGNVLISMSGEIKLTDFGIAFKSSREDEITKTGTLLGTPSYMSPEQIYSSKDVDYRTDIYSLGVILYEMLTGIKPFANQFTMENVVNIKKGKCPSIRSANKNVPPKLVKIIKKMMNPQKRKRFKNVSEFINKIQPFIMKKFKDPLFLKENFNKLIVKQNPSYELGHFKYPGSYLLLTKTVKILTIPVILLFLVISIRFLYPELFLRLTFPDKYGMVNVTIKDEVSINGGYVEFYSENRQYDKKIILNSGPGGIGINNIILPASKYTVYIYVHENLSIREFIVYSYKQTKVNNVTYDVTQPEISRVILDINVIDKNNNRINDYKIYYKKSNENSWSEYGYDTELYNGSIYDFSALHEKYNTSIIKNVSIGKNQEYLKINFVLSEKRLGVKFKNPGIPLKLKIDNISKGFYDIDGIVESEYLLTSDMEIFLTPGIHTVNLFNKERNINNDFKINLETNKDYIAEIFFNDENKKVTLNVY